MRTFDADPKDGALGEFLSADIPSTWIQVSEDALEIRGEPATFSLRFAAVCLSIPLLIFSVAQGGSLLAGEGSARVILGLAFLAAALLMAFLAHLNSEIRAKGSWFVLDRRNGDLHLPRAGVTLTKAQIDRVVEFAGIKPQMTTEGPGTVQIHEISVVARMADGKYAQYLVAAGSGKKLSPVAILLSEHYGARRLVSSQSRSPDPQGS